MFDEGDALASYWEELKPPDQKSSDVVPETPADISPVLTWASEIGAPGKSPILTISGRNQATVFDLLCRNTESRCVSVQIGGKLPRSFIRGIFRELLTSELTVEGPLREMADKANHVACDAYGLLWEGRFMLRENASGFDDYVEQMTDWIEGKSLEKGWRTLSSPQDQMRALCFLTALSAQNKLFERAIILFDGLSLIDDRNAAKEMTSTLAEVRRWALLAGCPLGILLGFTASRNDMARLRKLNQSLHAEVNAGLAWTKNSRRNTA